MNDCNNCGHDIGGCEISAGLSCSSSSALKNFKNHWIPKEKEMEKQKFIFDSEEQFIETMERLGWQSPHIENDYLPIARREDLIRKSELQTLVDEAEEMYRRWQNLAHDDTLDINFQLIVKLRNAFQALIKENERLRNEKR